jgi:hypothetical protein
MLLFSLPVLLILMAMPGNAQESADGRRSYFIPGLRAHYGFIIAHTSAIEAASKTNPIGLQVDLSWHFNSKKAYDFCNCLPRLGLSLNYWDYQSDHILGRSYSATFFAEPFFNMQHRVNFSLRPGFGLAYLTSPYDSLSNPLNQAYSTRIGYSLLLNISVYYRLTEKIVINTSFNYNHISNGGVKHPNKGLNYPTLSVGLDYSIHPLKFNQYRSDKPAHFKPRNSLLVGTFIGFKGLLIDDQTYQVYGLLSKYLFQLQRNSFLAAGMEFNIDQTKVKLAEEFESVDKNDRYIFSMTGGYEHSLGRFGLTFDLGIYLWNPDRLKDLIYQRYGAKYYFYKGFHIGFNLRAHRHYAEFFDIRIGWRT